MNTRIGEHRGGLWGKNNGGTFLFFLINCWSSVVASVVLPQLCNLHCIFFLCQKLLLNKNPIGVIFNEVFVLFCFSSKIY